MPEVREEDVYNALLRFKGKEKVEIGNAEITIELTPVDIHNIDSPDSILWINISLKLFGQNLRLRVPIPVEAEKHGIDDAVEDLDKFVERRRYPVEIPMLVIAEAGYKKREEDRTFPVKFTITQIPIRRLNEE